VTHHFLVVFSDSLLDFLGKLFTSLMSFMKFGLILGRVYFLWVGLESELDFLVVIDNLLLSLSHDFLTTLFSSCKFDLNLHFSFLNSISVIILLAFFNLFVVVGYTFLDSSSSLETKPLSSSEFGLVAFGLKVDVVLGAAVLDFLVVLSCTLDGISSSFGSPLISCSKLACDCKVLENKLSFLLADSSLTSHLNATGELKSLEVLLAVSRGLILFH